MYVDLVGVLSGNAIAPGSVPYAHCYGGHQFGSWAGQLGDGRATSLGEVVAVSKWAFTYHLVVCIVHAV